MAENPRRSASPTPILMTLKVHLALLRANGIIRTLMHLSARTLTAIIAPTPSIDFVTLCITVMLIAFNPVLTTMLK